MTSFANVLQVRVKEHMYTEFKQAMRQFRGNKSAFAGKYVRKVWDIETVFGEMWLRLGGIQGAYDADYFHVMKAKMESDIIKRTKQLYRTMPSEYTRDTHDQSVNYVWHKLDEIGMPNVIGACEDGDYIEADVDLTVGNACYSGMSSKFRAALGNGYDTLTGYFFVNSNLNDGRAQRWIELLREHGYLMPEVKTYYQDRAYEEDWDSYVLYQLTFPTDCCQYDKLYFQFSMLRQLLEYHGTINITFDLMEEFNLQFELAHMVAMMMQPNKRWLHIPWCMAEYNHNMTTAVRYAKAIRKFSPATEVFDKYVEQFKSSPLIESMVKNIGLRDVPSDARDLDTIHKLLR